MVYSQYLVAKLGAERIEIVQHLIWCVGLCGGVPYKVPASVHQ